MRLKEYRIFIGLALVLFGIHFNNNASAQGIVSDQKERAALLALYNATNGPNWNTKWRLTQINSYPILDSLPRGVSTTNGDITEIVLNGFNLDGYLPQQLNDLEALQVLSLTSNKLSGMLPVLDSLTLLKTLNLANHYFTGAFPTWIGKLNQLETLNLVSYPGDVPKLTGPIPSSISNLTGLKFLQLGNNNFSNAMDIPDSLSLLDNLQYLDLQSCMLTPNSVNIGLTGLPGLTQLHLGFNNSFVESDGTFPSKLNSLPNLQYVYLMGNGFDKFPTSFVNLTRLYYLDLSATNYSDTIKLGSTIDVLKQIPSLNYLYLTNCQIGGLPPDFIDLTIETLNLSNNPLQPALCNGLGDLPELQSLYINSCNLTSLPTNLSNSTSLKNLYAWYNHLQPIPDVIKDIPNLQTLELGGNAITSLPPWFGTASMDNLKKLVLSNNQLVTLPENFTKLRSLEELNISNNLLNGTWPLQFDTLTNIKHLNLSYNQIDSLPDLSKLNQLQIVYVQHNKLDGKVPAFLSNKTSNKTTVDISFNFYTSVDSASHFNNTSPNVTISNNRFTFEDILEFKPATGTYIYSPQPIVDTVRSIFSYPGSSFTLVAHIDTTIVSPSRAKYQWFKYVNGVNDSALFSAPQVDGYYYTVLTTRTSDQGDKYYYKITYPALPSLTLTSHPQTMVFSCKGMLTKFKFDAKRYLCAMNFVPTIQYSSGGRTTSYQWNFGDGSTSTEKSPWYAFQNEGTRTVSLKLNFTVGACQADSTISKQVNYELPDEFVSDSLVNVETDTRHEILSVSAATFSDSWALQHPANITSSNSFLTGAQGVWRNDGMFVYDVPRSKSVTTNIAQDGTFTLEQFNWGSAQVNAIPNWTRANTMTQYSPYSYELENRDVLGIYSAALYDYGGHLPSANGVNMRNNEMAFTGFEFLDNNASGNLVFGTQPLPEYYLFNVKSAKNHIAIIEATEAQLNNVAKVDVSGKVFKGTSLFSSKRTNYIPDNAILCIQPHPTNPAWSIIVLRRPLFPDMWTGQIKVKTVFQPTVTPNIDNTFAHTGRSSLKISSATSIEQKLLKYDSGKVYFMNAWVSVKNSHLKTPILAAELGIDVIFKNSSGVVLSTTEIKPSGQIIEGWQQVRGSFVCPDKLTKIELKFKQGSTGTAWYDDLRIHPETGNMKSYVYDVRDYRLRAILDEENFATLYFYDDEGNLHLVKKETERGIKTISENVSHQAIQQSN